MSDIEDKLERIAIAVERIANKVAPKPGEMTLWGVTFEQAKMLVAAEFSEAKVEIPPPSADALRNIIASRSNQGIISGPTLVAGVMEWVLAAWYDGLVRYLR